MHAASQRDLEDLLVERQRVVDVPDLERDVVDPDEAAASSRQDQVHVAELVPAGSRAPCAARYERSSRSAPAAASSIWRCDESGSCQPLSRPSTACSPRSGVTTRLVQPSPAETVPSAAAVGLERADDRRADCDHATAPAVHGVDESRGRLAARGSARGTAARRARATRRRCAASPGRRGCRATTSSVTSSVVNGRPALGISALPGLEREDGLVRVERPRSGT